MQSIKADEVVDIYLFHSSLCSHCQAEIAYLQQLQEENPNIELHLYETINNKENDELMQYVKQQMNVNNVQVPFTVIGNTYYIGFEDSIKESMDSLIKEELNNPSVNVVDKIFNNESIDGITIRNGEINKLVTFFGTIDPNEISLPILSIIIGFIDGFNPCAMWVLLFIISMLLNMKNKKRMWAIGLTFLITSALVYFAFMVAWLKVAITLTQVSWVRLIIGLIALIGALINITSYLEERKKDDGCHVVDDKKRKKLFKKVKTIISSVDDKGNMKGFIAALIGIMGLAISVNMIELACSSGLPLVFTQILALNDLSLLHYLFYIVLYIFFFLIDDIVIFVLAMTTLKVTGISTKYNKLSHLLGGVIMLIIGLLMIFKPSWIMFNF
jgi:glutaredoxin